MSKVVVWGRMVVPAERNTEFRQLVKELVAKVADADPGTVHYAFHQDPDAADRYLVQEVYASPEAQLGHLANVGPLLGRFGELGTRTEYLDVAGDPAPEARSLLNGSGARYWSTVDEL